MPLFDFVFDQFELRIKPDSGAAKVVLNGTMLGGTTSWKHHSISLAAFKGKTVTVEFKFLSMGLPPFGFGPTEGVYIDNVVISNPCD